jgi:hypothetical protein
MEGSWQGMTGARNKKAARFPGRWRARLTIGAIYKTSVTLVKGVAKE